MEDKDLIVNAIVRLGDKMDSLRDQMHEDFRICHNKIDEHIKTSDEKHNKTMEKVGRIDKRVTGMETKWGVATVLVAFLGANFHKFINFFKD